MSDSCDPMDCSPRGFSVRGISQTRILEWVAISFSRGLPHPGIEPEPPALQADSLPTKPPGKPYVSIDLHTCIYVYINIGFPSDSVGKETTMQETQSLGAEDPPEEEIATHSSILS